MLKELGWTMLAGITLGFFAHHWQVSALDAFLRLVFIGLAVGIPAALLLFLYALLTRR